MTLPCTPTYDHLPEVEDWHPEQLCPLLFQLWSRARKRGGAAVLRWQYLGGNPDGVTLFCHSELPDGAIVVKWSRQHGQYFPGYIERGAVRVDPLNAESKRRRPNLFRLFADILRSLYGAP